MLFIMRLRVSVALGKGPRNPLRASKNVRGGDFGISLFSLKEIGSGGKPTLLSFQKKKKESPKVILRLKVEKLKSKKSPSLKSLCLPELNQEKEKMGLIREICALNPF